MIEKLKNLSKGKKIVGGLVCGVLIISALSMPAPESSDSLVNQGENEQTVDNKEVNNDEKIDISKEVNNDEKIDISKEPNNENVIEEEVIEEEIKEEPVEEEVINSSLGFSLNEDSLTYNNKEYKIINVDGGDLSGNRQSNVAVNIGFGDRQYWSITNEYGQVVNVFAENIIVQNDETESVNSNGRYYSDEAKVPGTEHADLDEGHVIADSLGGVANAYNITPQDSTLNRHGDQSYMEDQIRKAGGCTNFVATISYDSTDTQIPSRYKYEYTLNGNSIVDEFNNVNPESTQEVTPEPEVVPTPEPEVVPTPEPEVVPTPEPEVVPTPEPEVVPTPEPEVVPTPEPEVVPEQSNDLSSVDTNGNGKVTIAEAEAAGYSMPIYSDHWLYPYMIDRDSDGMVGE